MAEVCRWCGGEHVRCPDIKAIEYHENGVVKRVEFLTTADFCGATSWPPSYVLSVAPPPLAPIWTAKLA